MPPQRVYCVVQTKGPAIADYVSPTTIDHKSPRGNDETVPVSAMAHSPRETDNWQSGPKKKANSEHWCLTRHHQFCSATDKL